MILEMVDADELDINLMALLKTNINTARQARPRPGPNFAVLQGTSNAGHRCANSRL
jgi:hypothetical protein